MATMMSGGNASSPERYIDSVYLSLNEFSLQDSRGGSCKFPLIRPGAAQRDGGLKIPVHRQFYSCFRPPLNARIWPGFRYEIRSFSDLLLPHRPADGSSKPDEPQEKEDVPAMKTFNFNREGNPKC